jgi:hypothetical protein
MTANNTTIETVSGLLVDLAAPKPDDFRITDIAWAISREPRFGGHTVTALVYSVGQHSIQVCKILQALWTSGSIQTAFYNHVLSDDPIVRAFIAKHKVAPNWLMMFGLLHDASEAYLRDLPSPVKSLPGLKEAYMAVERKIMAIILDKFGVTEFLEVEDREAAEKLVHWADLYARTVEAYHFMPSRAGFWPAQAKIDGLSLIDLQNFELPKPGIEVYEEFLGWFEELSR